MCFFGCEEKERWKKNIDGKEISVKALDFCRI